VPSVITGPLRYAVIGAGSAARAHLTAMLGKPNVVLVGIADPAPPTAWRIPADRRDAPHFTDAAKLLRQQKPHVVSICSPPKYHHELTLLALAAGAHVICEKPMAMTVREAERMEEARVAAGRLGAINFSYRNLTAFRYARQLIAQGQLGRLTRASVAYLQSFMAASGVSWSWRHDIRIAGFGVLGDLGVHMIDGVRFVTGLEFQRVVASARTLLPQKLDGKGVAQQVTTDTHAVFMAELSGNAMAIFETTQLAPGYGDLFRLEISGERGSLSVDTEHPDDLRLHASPEPPGHAIWKTDLPPVVLPAAFPGRSHPSTPGAIVDAIRGATVEYPDFADGVAAQRVLDALRRSMISEKWVSLR
jgi:predicted dehydrogenase